MMMDLDKDKYKQQVAGFPDMRLKIEYMRFKDQLEWSVGHEYGNRKHTNFNESLQEKIKILEGEIAQRVLLGNYN